MICSRCKKEINEDAVFCPHCGIKLEKCPTCHQPIIGGSKFCSSCGTQLNHNSQSSQVGGYYQPLSEIPPQVLPEIPQESFQDVEVNEKTNKKMIIIGVVILIVLSSIGFVYLKYGPNFSFQNEPKQEVIPSVEMKIGSTTSFSSYTGNINQNGGAYFDGKSLYTTNIQGSIVKMNADLSNQVTLNQEKSQYLTVVDETIYYTDSEDYFCSMTTEGKDKKILIKEKVFYPIIKDKKVYYQLDSDAESIHIYDLETKKDTKINNRTSYNINVIDNKIYYSSTDGIYSIGIDGKGEEKLVADEYGDISNVIYQDKKLYYCLGNQILVYNTETKKIEVIVQKDAYRLMNITDEYIYYYTVTGSIRSYNLKTKDQKFVYNGNASYVYVVGDKLIVYTSSQKQQNDARIIMDYTGEHQKALFKSDSGKFV